MNGGIYFGLPMKRKWSSFNGSGRTASAAARGPGANVRSCNATISRPTGLSVIESDRRNHIRSEAYGLEDQEPAGGDDSDRKLFLRILSRVTDRFNWLCHAYCLMNNHCHLVIETPDGNLSKGMRQLNGVYTQAFNQAPPSSRTSVSGTLQGDLDAER